MVFSPSLPPNHSKTTRILPDVVAAAARLAWRRRYGTGPMPPSMLKPMPPAPILIRSRREMPLSFNGFFVLIATRPLPHRPTHPPVARQNVDSSAVFDGRSDYVREAASLPRFAGRDDNVQRFSTACP